ncbi:MULTISPECIES: MarR family winged helix-turn-helix transcriptional regulator [Gordonibacter]|uniref:MarR family transcriptional regulator n=1 Tax=Gordonibacter faecis TaxID=3047475 RepID=A0ABT7DKE5_9ACTN|nr:MULTISPECIES: MarR family transcriptional regulator [unclassified Gordonibacter]MDJ1649999.1 MarR family transcriptional regulator [Gordonibacter sp. KGMB12511]HIW76681.1 MarR family transcriptional regulator [Candidatus Gordonibacter avicola]
MPDTDRPHKNLAQRLVYTVTRYQQHMQNLLKEHGIGQSEYPVLIYLVHHDGPDMFVSQSDIAKRQFRDPALITRAAKGLAKKGYITVETSTTNRARHTLRLTPKGRELARLVDDLVWQWEEQAFANFTDEERRTLKQLLAKLNLPE